MGSSTLGVVSQESDIDLVCVVPQIPSGIFVGGGRVSLREHFMQDFGDTLAALPHVKDFVRIDTAANPTLSCRWKGVDLDILFCDLQRSTIAENFLKDGRDLYLDDILVDLDESCIRALNGYRVARIILQLMKETASSASSTTSMSSAVPEDSKLSGNQHKGEEQVQKFRNVLRFVKWWAKQRGIYSNICGYFGGITWSICVAHVLKKYPDYTEAQLILQFFKDLHAWDWENEPLLLREVAPTPKVADLSLVHRISGKHQWNGHVEHMAVLTPVFPAMNSCYNVTESTRRVLEEQLYRAHTMATLVEDMVQRPEAYVVQGPPGSGSCGTKTTTTTGGKINGTGAGPPVGTGAGPIIGGKSSGVCPSGTTASSATAGGTSSSATTSTSATSMSRCTPKAGTTSSGRTGTFSAVEGASSSPASTAGKTTNNGEGSLFREASSSSSSSSSSGGACTNKANSSNSSTGASTANSSSSTSTTTPLHVSKKDTSASTASSNSKTPASIVEEIDWSVFYAPLPFFSDYSRYLRVTITSHAGVANFMRLRGLLEAKLRYLVQYLDRIEGLHVHLCPYEGGVVPHAAHPGAGAHNLVFSNSCSGDPSASRTSGGLSSTSRSSTSCGPPVTTTTANTTTSSTSSSATQQLPTNLPTTSASTNSLTASWYLGLTSSFGSLGGSSTTSGSASVVLDLRPAVAEFLNLVALEFERDPKSQLSFQVLAREELVAEQEKLSLGSMGLGATTTSSAAGSATGTATTSSSIMNRAIGIATTTARTPVAGPHGCASTSSTSFPKTGPHDLEQGQQAQHASTSTNTSTSKGIQHASTTSSTNTFTSSKGHDPASVAVVAPKRTSTGTSGAPGAQSVKSAGALPTTSNHGKKSCSGGKDEATSLATKETTRIAGASSKGELRTATEATLAGASPTAAGASPKASPKAAKTAPIQQNTAPPEDDSTAATNKATEVPSEDPLQLCETTGTASKPSDTPSKPGSEGLQRQGSEVQNAGLDSSSPQTKKARV
ncbi:unnamed protein product [Amoebophrya sp. A25]|nr:unnamed protein product [Amoebophrya sp. A25]|eukprot:GSA25T00015536001.1